MRETMQRRIQIAAALCLLAAGMIALAAPAMAAPAEKYLHVKVEDPAKDESVHINVTLAMAEKILPAINDRDLHNGKVWIHHADMTEMNGVDIRALLDALRTAPDNEFVTVKDKDSDVRVAKANGDMIVHITDKKNKEQKVDVMVPMKIVDALFSTGKNDELDVAAALRALSDAGDVLLVTVQESTQKVRIWVDSRNTQD
jgi:sensor histidine kinase regulating citrate/malate metabolism